MTRWEYKSVELGAEKHSFFTLGGRIDIGKLDALLGDLGAQGWELVCAFDTNAGAGETRFVVAIFKRPLA